MVNKIKYITDKLVTATGKEEIKDERRLYFL